MTRAYVYADEAGDMTFSRNNASKYFILCTVTCPACQIGADLLDLRRDMIWRNMPVKDYFHATEDAQAVRDEVYDFLKNYKFRIDATVLEKSKAQPQTRATKERFYQYAWFYHLRHVAPRITASAREMLITAASIGTKKSQAVFTSAVNDVVQQTLRMPRNQWRTHFTQSMADPCLQVADYCTWAIQRKWERGDVRSYDLIKASIASEYDLWRTGTQHYY
jgi:hypothetical protein